MVYRSKGLELWTKILEYEKDMEKAESLVKRDAIRLEISFIYREYIDLLHSLSSQWPDQLLPSPEENKKCDDGLTFGKAIDHLNFFGGGIYRKVWSSAYLISGYPEGYTKSIILIKGNEKTAGWKPTDCDMLSNDWVICHEPNCKCKNRIENEAENHG